MEPITTQLDAHYDEAVLASPGIDHFCSSSAWILPANDHLHPRRGDAAFRWRDADGRPHYLMLRRYAFGGIRTLEPFEITWGLACPIIGANPGEAAPRFADLLLDLTSQWDVLTLCGLPQNQAWVPAFTRRLAQTCSTRHGSTMTRYIADLSDGVEAYLARRSPRFRRNIRRALRLGEKHGVTFEAAHDGDPEQICARIELVEDESWKSLECGGIDVEPGESFYGDMVVRLCAAGRLKLIFAKIDGRDVGYCLGGVLGDTYRGLQFSFDMHWPQLSLGNLMQVHQMHELAAEGIRRYDLGTTADHYKRRWADETLQSDTLRAIAPGLGVYFSL